jgi:hypothetical protein
MSGLDAAHAANIVDASLGTASFVATTTPLKCRIMTANGSATANGTELSSGGSYVAGTGMSPATFGSASTTTGAASTSVALTQTNMPTAATLAGVELWDSAATPKRKWWGALTATKSTNAGDTFTIPSGSLTATDL